MASGGVTPGGGGGPAAGSYLPVANSSGVTVDTTTYADPIAGGGAKLTTLVFSGVKGLLAVAKSGDAFPRWLMSSDATDGLYLGRGNVDPYTGPVAEIFVTSDRRVVVSGLLATLTVGGIDTNVGTYVNVNPTLLVGSVFVQAGTADPTVNFGGNVGDLYIRADANLILYQCTVAGVAGAATWVPVLQPGSPKGIITSGALPTVTISSGTGRQVSTARDVETVTPFTGDATNNAATCKCELSPDNVTYSTLNTESVAAALNLTGALDISVNVRVPAGWYIKLTAVHGTLGTTTYY